MKKIILCGYMASGKTTIARLLAQALGFNYIDLDEIIVLQTGKTIQELFAEGGEIQFRKKEHVVLQEIVNNNEAFVLSLGGGTPCYANNHEFLQRDDVISVYLKASIPEIISRLANDVTPRPMLNNLKGEELKEFIGQHLFERSYYYMQAKHKVITDGKTTENIVNEIMSLF
ncbi:shikimate kinase [Flavobacterium salilacus subsp. salilacus]|uniref:shikimate kinase n=1 Tax=Flavobacterium TaxID=237 RepID=UPI0010754293|nr:MULTISPECIES: shikimate kinase [Flavobacterium]KAF2519687.1 shikimate kinase [Flavobacterium salilacus subsp. salilacus]MBE1614425.1 shikimate kinase [Flavobacterium sp. SaA2.13]